MMRSLKILYLRGCHNFRKFPKIQGKMERLSRIYLNRTRIQELPSSIVNLPNLSVLILFGCISLASLPESICMLQSLTRLDVRGCKKLATLPQHLGNMGCLQQLLLSTVTRLPSSVIHLKNLNIFSAVELPSSISQKRGVLGWFSDAASLFLEHRNPRHGQNSLYQELPSLLRLTSLRGLGLCNLREGKIPPVDLGMLSSLEFLILCHNQFTRFPFTISQFSMLKTLNLSMSPRLEVLPELPPSVVVLFANYCKSLTTITGFSLAHRVLRQITFLGCRGLGHQPFDTCTSTVVQNALQGDIVVKQQTTIILPGSEIPNWFHCETIGVGQTVIKLPANWHDVTTGISLCVVADFMGLTRPVSLSLSTEHIPATNSSGLYRSQDLHTWMEYVPLDLLERSCVGIVRRDWISTTPGLILTISTDIGVKICGVRLTQKKINFEAVDDPGQAKLLKCFREAKCDGITYTLQSGCDCILKGSSFDSLSWNEKHKRYRSRRLSMKVHTEYLQVWT